MSEWSGWTLSRVLADGVFDPLHFGHIRYLSAAASYGDLIVNIAPDEAIVAKGRKPFQTRMERAMTVQSLSMVKAVRCHRSLAKAVIEEVPAVLVKGEDWRGKLPEDVIQACQDMQTQIVYTPTLERSSTERLS